MSNSGRSPARQRETRNLVLRIRHNGNDIPRKALLRFHEPDGRIRVEMLSSSDDFADLVDPNDGSIRHAEPFAMHGGEWRIESVIVTGDLIRIDCVSTVSKAQLKSAAAPSSRSSIRR